MFFHEPCHGFRIRRAQAEPRAEAAGDLGAGDGVVFQPALGDVVQEQADIEKVAVLDAGHQFVGEPVFGFVAGFDLGQHADAADQMLVDGVVMIEVELHHRDDVAEFRHEFSEHARLVHAPKHDFGRVFRADNLAEKLVCLLILAQFRVDKLERAAREAERRRVKLEVMAVGDMEEADEIDGIALEHLIVGDVQPLVVEHEGGEILHRPPAPPRPAGKRAGEPRRHFRVNFFQRGADDGGQIADVLGDEKVVLHEALDLAQPRMLGVAEAERHIVLHVEGKALLGAPGQEMQIAAHGP